VNTPPPKGGGFRLRLKAGSVRLAADFWRHDPEVASASVELSYNLFVGDAARQAPLFTPERDGNGASPQRRATSHAA